MALICICLFVASFAQGPGPITWSYMSEITNDHGISAATGVNWFANICISSTTNFMFDKLKGYTFVIFGISCLISVFFLTVFMKETQGLSEAEC